MHASFLKKLPTSLLKKISGKQPGAMLIEVLLAVALLAILSPALIASFVTTNQSQTFSQTRIGAVGSMREMYEAVRTVRAADWDLVATPGTYHPVRRDGSWYLDPGYEVIDTLTRSIDIENVSRSEDGEIVITGGLDDPSTKKVILTAAWDGADGQTLSQEFYITRYLENEVVINTDPEDFEEGDHEGTTVSQVNGGEIVLGAGGSGNWCAAELTETEFDLPKSGVATAVYAREGDVVASTGENASGVSLARMAVSQDDPPQVSMVGTADGYKTNGVYVDGNYAYLLTDSNQKEVVIVDLNQQDSNGKYAEVGYVNIPTTLDGMEMEIVGNMGIVMTKKYLATVDLSSKTGSRPVYTYLDMPGTATHLDVVGSLAFVSMIGINPTGQLAHEMHAVHISADGQTLTPYGYVDIPSAGAMDVTVNSSGTRAYLALISGSNPEMLIVDTSGVGAHHPQLPVIGSYQDTTGLNPRAIEVVTGNKVILGGQDGQEYQVINVANETNPTKCGGVDVDSGVRDLSVVLEEDNDAFTYVVTGDASAELKIVQGGPGGQFATEGMYTSGTLDVGTSSVFNYFELSALVRPNTELKYHVALADAVNNSCDNAVFDFVGPDKSADTYFTESEPFPFDDDGSGYENPARCFRYRVYLSSSDPSSTPEFYEMTVNYSP